MSELKHLYYRGQLRSCNYSCGYCPFSKHKISQRELLQDAEALKRFTVFLTQGRVGCVSVLMTPYGEALIHDYYWRALAQLTASPFILAAGCQTNLSFAVEDMLEIFQQCGGQIERLRLWCTFHGAMTTVEDFAEQCRRLTECGIAYSVGAVGEPSQLAQLKKLRASLPEEIYLWINRMEGLKRAYTPEQREAFKAIDPYFDLELSGPSADMNRCSGGRQSLLVRGDGQCLACHISGVKLGNLYTGDWREQGAQTNCRAKRCHCQLAYSNRVDIPELAFFDTHPAFRQPIFDGCKQLEAIFIDLDGTMTDSVGELRRRLCSALPLLTKQYRLYLATQRPYPSAKRICGEFIQYFDGGVFADGGEVRVSCEQSVLVPLALDEKAVDALVDTASQMHMQVRLWQRQGQLYKITLLNKSRCSVAPDKFQALQQLAPGCRLALDGSMVSVVAERAGKWSGMLLIGKHMGFGPETMAYLGNSANDVAIFERVACSIAVVDAEPEALAAAKYCISGL